MVIPNQAAALIVLPTNVHEKLARKLKPEDKLGAGVFKLNLKYVDFALA